MIKTKLFKIFMILATILIPAAAITGVTVSVALGGYKFDQTEVVSTALPTMFIDLYDENQETYDLANVTKEAYVSSKITITNTDEQYCVSNLESQFKGRGNASWYESKKGYKIKLNKKASLFGRGKNKHWVLNACENFHDKTMYRNYLAYNMASTIFDNIEYTTNAVWVDVYVNGLYQGVYILCEHVRVDNSRVNIQSDYGVLDTGYLIEYDAYATGIEGIDYFRINGVKYPFTVHSPDPEEYESDGDISTEEYMAQVNYIKEYIQNVYTAGLQKDFAIFSSLVDVNSFVDMYILHELFKNTDTGFSSFYLYKKAGGKLYAGPAWDFDGTAVATRGDNSPQGIYVAESVVHGSLISANELLISLYNTPEFKSLVVERWQQLSPLIQNFIDERMNEEVYDEILYAMSRNISLWYKVPEYFAESIWLKEVDILKNWLDQRIIFLNSEWN